MGLVNIVVNGRRFKLGCDDGEERHLLGLAEHLESHVEILKHDVGAVPDEQLYLMAGLMVCDELWDARDLLQRAGGSAQRPSGNPSDSGKSSVASRPVARPEKGPADAPSRSTVGKVPAKSPKAM